MKEPEECNVNYVLSLVELTQENNLNYNVFSNQTKITEINQTTKQQLMETPILSSNSYDINDWLTI